jgi:aminoglycoside phosphotransferase (APT) family kinase protein
MSHDISAIAKQFQTPGRFVSAEPYGNGHINDTYAATYEQAGSLCRYIHQRINHDVFKDPIAVMANIQRITEHVRRKLTEQSVSDLDRQTLTLVPTWDDLMYYRDPGGNVWRTYWFIGNARTYDVVESPAQAYQGGKAFGHFQQLLEDLPGPRLIETIPDFHHTPKRFAALKQAIEADVVNRAKSAQVEIDFALQHEAMVDVLLDLQARGQIPERVTHNDTKINNVMLDNETGQGLCVVDLDTVMPGLALYDFGDMVRTATCLAAEDERDLSKVIMEMPLFEALARGYLEAAGAFLNETEKRYLAFSGKLITFEIGIRFLTDYLAGDTYFKIHRQGHNLDRCRTQLKLVQSIIEQEEAMNRLVERI